jgi:hypothetical protein
MPTQRRASQSAIVLSRTRLTSHRRSQPRAISGSLRDYLGPRLTYQLWHNDQTWEQHTPSTSLMAALELPDGGPSALDAQTESSPCYDHC